MPLSELRQRWLKLLSKSRSVLASSELWADERVKHASPPSAGPSCGCGLMVFFPVAWLQRRLHELASSGDRTRPSWQKQTMCRPPRPLKRSTQAFPEQRRRSQTNPFPRNASSRPIVNQNSPMVLLTSGNGKRTCSSGKACSLPGSLSRCRLMRFAIKQRG